VTLRIAISFLSSLTIYSVHLLLPRVILPLLSSPVDPIFASIYVSSHSLLTFTFIITMASSTSINVAIAHVITYLTRPLIVSYSAATIVKLQLVLETNFTALFAPSWVPKEPLRGSGRRCLTLSPNCLPPRAIYAACLATGVQWFDWIALLGGREFDLFVDPGCISVRFGKKGTPGSHLIVWSGESSTTPALDESKVQAQFKVQADARAKMQRKTLAQQLLEEDEDDEDQLFALIADQVSAPTRMSPIPIRSSSPLSVISDQSRSSSRSSNSSSGFSFDSYGSDTTISTLSSSSFSSNGLVEAKQSRREKARKARVFVDPTKTEVTPYDGGKTNVLTGGVMLGGAPKERKATRSTQPSVHWRSSIRA
jgi:hypothetical protein